MKSSVLKPKAVFYCDHWQNGGVESYLMDMLRSWNFEKTQVELVTSEKTTDIYDEEIKSFGVKHTVLMDKLYPSPITRILHNLSCFRAYINEKPCDVLYLNLSNSFTMIYAKYAYKALIPVRVVHSHCSGIGKGLTKPLKELAHFLGRAFFSKYATDFCACSSLAGEWMFSAKQRKKKSVKVIPIGVDTAKFAFSDEKRLKLREELKLNDKFVIGNIGRLAPEKNQSFLLKLYSEYVKKIGDEKSALLLVGDGELRETLAREAEELKIKNNVIFYGFSSDPAPLYSAMDMFCLTSSFEGFGIVALEAQACGLYSLLSESVPDEVMVSEAAKRLPFDTSLWVSEIERIRKIPAYNRADFAEKVIKAGYGAGCAAPMVQELIMEAVRREGV